MAEFRYRLARRPHLDAAGRLHPKGAFILSRHQLFGDNFVPVSADKEDIGPARDKPGPDGTPGKVHINPTTTVADPFADVTDVPALKSQIALLQAQLEAANADGVTPFQGVADAERQAAAESRPFDRDSNGDDGGSEAATYYSFTKPQLAEKLDAAGVAKPEGVTDWLTLKKDDLIGLLKG